MGTIINDPFCRKTFYWSNVAVAPSRSSTSVAPVTPIAKCTPTFSPDSIGRPRSFWAWPMGRRLTFGVWVSSTTSHLLVRISIDIVLKLSINLRLHPGRTLHRLSIVPWRERGRAAGLYHGGLRCSSRRSDRHCYQETTVLWLTLQSTLCDQFEGTQTSTRLEDTVAGAAMHGCDVHGFRQQVFDVSIISD